MLRLPPLDAFATWLAGRPWDAVVGHRTECTRCPLAHWLRDVLQAHSVHVDEETVAIERLHDEWTFTPTPPAYARFIEAIDYAGATPRRAVQVVEVRNVLQELAREEVPPETQ